MRAALSLYPRIKRIVYDKSSGSSLTKRPLARCKMPSPVFTCVEWTSIDLAGSIDAAARRCTRRSEQRNQSNALFSGISGINAWLLPAQRGSNKKEKKRRKNFARVYSVCSSLGCFDVAVTSQRVSSYIVGCVSFPMRISGKYFFSFLFLVLWNQVARGFRDSVIKLYGEIVSERNSILEISGQRYNICIINPRSFNLQLVCPFVSNW